MDIWIKIGKTKVEMSVSKNNAHSDKLFIKEKNEKDKEF